MLLPYFFKLTCVPVKRYKVQNMVQGTHPQRGVQDTLLILNNNHAVGVTDEVGEITWFYKQR